MVTCSCKQALKFVRQLDLNIKEDTSVIQQNDRTFIQEKRTPGILLQYGCRVSIVNGSFHTILYSSSFLLIGFRTNNAF